MVVAIWRKTSAGALRSPATRPHGNEVDGQPLDRRFDVPTKGDKDAQDRLEIEGSLSAPRASSQFGAVIRITAPAAL